MRNTIFNAIFAVVATAPLNADAKCFSTWSEADAVARREELVAVEEVSSLAYASEHGAEVVKTTLCEEDGRYVYRLVLRGPRGHFRTMIVDAKKPFAK